MKYRTVQISKVSASDSANRSRLDKIIVPVFRMLPGVLITCRPKHRLADSDSVWVIGSCLLSFQVTKRYFDIAREQWSTRAPNTTRAVSLALSATVRKRDVTPAAPWCTRVVWMPLASSSSWQSWPSSRADQSSGRQIGDDTASFTSTGIYSFDKNDDDLSISILFVRLKLCRPRNYWFLSFEMHILCNLPDKNCYAGGKRYWHNLQTH